MKPAFKAPTSISEGGQAFTEHGPLQRAPGRSNELRVRMPVVVRRLHVCQSGTTTC